MSCNCAGRSLLFAVLTTVGLLAIAVSPTALAQTPTPDQIKAFQSLPPDQQSAVLQQLGISGTAGGTRSVGGAPAANDSQITVRRPGGAIGDGQSGDAQGSDLQSSDSVQTSDRRFVSQPIEGGEQLLVELVVSKVPAPLVGRETTADGRAVPRQDPTLRTQTDDRNLRQVYESIIERNPYELSTSGVLQLPGFEPIPLAGLTRRQIEARLSLHPRLRDFKIIVSVLRLTPDGAKALKPFGYDLFKSSATAFVPGTDIPVPADYKVGAGDVFGVQLYGQQSQTLSMPVGRDGTISFPQLGPVNVDGLDFSGARHLLESRVRQQMIGTQARVSLSELRSTRVFVLGDAGQPGSYVVGGLSTVTNALFASGGVKPIGSLRRIEVKRDGKVLRRLDLYDVLLSGDTSNDIRLQTGDVVFVPPVGATVGVSGEVRRPAIYELRGEQTALQVVQLAGGLTPDSDPHVVTVERSGNSQGRRIVEIDLESTAARSFAMADGDVVRISAKRPLLENPVTLSGLVFRPGTYAYRSGMRLSDLIGSVDEAKPGADLHYILIRRQPTGSQAVESVSADLPAALAGRGSPRDVLLQPRDELTVFSLTSPREHVVGPLLDEMQRQSDPSLPMTVVTIAGVVNAPGRYPLEPGMRVSDLMRAGGGLQDSAYTINAELTRHSVSSGDAREIAAQQLDMAAIRRGDTSADVFLRPYDIVTIRLTPDWGRSETIELVGEVRFPGSYQARRGESLSSVIARAGGLTALAFPDGAVFTRDELKAREREQLDRLADRLQNDLGALALQASQTSPTASQSLSAGQSLLEQLKSAKPVGRLVIDLNHVLASNGGDADLFVRNGDRLVIPRISQEVSVLGEVQNATSHLYRKGLRRDDLIALSGGYTLRADKGRSYVVRANGSVAAQSSGWLATGNVEVRLGDTVVVPLDAEKMRPLPMWTSITTILYNLAIAATAIARL